MDTAATLWCSASAGALNWGGILLMSLGAQWYILFNVIAEASAIPSDLREAAAVVAETHPAGNLPRLFTGGIPPPLLR
ncbi:hypothetical protein [Prauserella sp. PE36]|uniref:hypothetical protein n=1 Tax=Prauserella TaxID=142577 RepID=UPI0011BF99D3|nr:MULTISPECIES: hypothetical protein [Prauserella]